MAICKCWPRSNFVLSGGGFEILNNYINGKRKPPLTISSVDNTPESDIILMKSCLFLHPFNKGVAYPLK